jgi:D-tagatose-1,6-bisphosphate aldolase subunit GatZ/KbaZ
MDKAETLIAAYVEAGYAKIHLDCSMSCADDPKVLDDETVAQRTARLMEVAEHSAHRSGVDLPTYVIGTEVPVPGGAHETLGLLTPTPADRARRTIDAHRAAFEKSGLGHVWPRVMALVVQPGVEFDHLQVIDYQRDATVALRRILDNEPHLVFEAHSTDYQRPAQLRELVEDHWAVLKVGPGLTFAMREALFALAHIENELVPQGARSNLIDVIERQMLASPKYWQGYYDGDPTTQQMARRYSYSDRLRYYWADDEVDGARLSLLENLDRVGIPMPLVSQFLTRQYDRIRAGELELSANALVIDRVRDAMRPYAQAVRGVTK